MASKTIIITGASDGIGKAAARRLHELGHTVVIVGRSPDKTRAVAEDLGIDYLTADFSRLPDVRTLARTLKRRYPSIDVLINNAGGIFAHKTLTRDRFETTFQVNYLAPFLLTNLLMDPLIAGGATVINTSSSAHLMGRLDLTNLNGRGSYSKWRTYGTTKLEDLMFARELTRRFRGRGITGVAFHPGIVRTSFDRELSGPAKFLFSSPLSRVLGIVDADQGADTMVWLATSSPGRDFEPGGYYAKRKKAFVLPAARDTESSSELWNASEDLLMEKFRY